MWIKQLRTNYKDRVSVLPIVQGIKQTPLPMSNYTNMYSTVCRNPQIQAK